MNRIKELREQKKISQVKLANMLNTTQANISAWENGRWQPDQNALLKLADLFNTTIDYILGRDTIISVPSEYANVPVAFFDGIRDLSQDDINAVIDFMEYLKSKKK